ncbi:MAG TPA: DUF6335 family protein [Anaerolineales bacterium]|jgi:hypothetical protein|nr:DUF6335 family protein [Anaerolineales bacterium]
MAEKDKGRSRDLEKEDIEELEQEEEEAYYRSIDTPADEGKYERPEESPTGSVLADQDTEEESRPLKEAQSEEYLEVDTNEAAVMGEIEEYTQDESVEEDFDERQRLTSGSQELLEELHQHHSTAPDLSGGDVDAAWEDVDAAGEEGVGGTTPTPDQDVVDELGDALGISYEPDEPLHTEEKLEQRDQERWELNPASAEPEEEESEEES